MKADERSAVQRTEEVAAAAAAPGSEGMVGAQRDGGKKLLLPSSSLPPSLLIPSQQPGFTLWNLDRKNPFESSCYLHMATFVIRVLIFAPNKFLDFFPVCKMASVLCAGKGESPELQSLFVIVPRHQVSPWSPKELLDVGVFFIPHC